MKTPYIQNVAEDVANAEEQLKKGAQKEEDKSKTKKERDHQESSTEKSKLQDVSQDKANEEEIKENTDDVIHSEWVEEVETSEEQLKEDAQAEEESSQSSRSEKFKAERQKRYSYLERAHKNPPKKKVQVEDPVQSPEKTDKEIKSEEYKIEEHHNLSEDAKENVVNVVAGSLSGFLSTALSHPLGEIKRRSQLQDNRKLRECIWQEVRVRYAEKGLRVFWKGHTRAQILGIFHNVILFWTYSHVMTVLDEIQAIEKYDLLQNFSAGFCSGAATTIVIYPVDEIMSRIAVILRIKRKFRKIDLRPFLKVDIWHMFYRGILPSFLHRSLNYGYKFLFYNMLCEHVFATYKDQERDDLPSEKLMLAGASAGILAHSLTYPLDLITRRMKTHSLKKHGFKFDRNCRTVLQCFLLIMRTDGFFGLYRGILPVLLRSTVNTSVMFAVFDKMHKLMEEEI